MIDMKWEYDWLLVYWMFRLNMIGSIYNYILIIISLNVVRVEM